MYEYYTDLRVVWELSSPINEFRQVKDLIKFNYKTNFKLKVLN